MRIKGTAWLLQRESDQYLQGETLAETSYFVFTSCYLKNTFGGSRRSREHIGSRAWLQTRNQPLLGYSALSEADCLTKLNNSSKPSCSSLPLSDLCLRSRDTLSLLCNDAVAPFQLFAVQGLTRDLFDVTILGPSAQLPAEVDRDEDGEKEKGKNSPLHSSC